jgi:hypothetical protein
MPRVDLDAQRLEVGERRVDRDLAPPLEQGADRGQAPPGGLGVVLVADVHEEQLGARSQREVEPVREHVWAVGAEIGREDDPADGIVGGAGGL